MSMTDHLATVTPIRVSPCCELDVAERTPYLPAPPRHLAYRSHPVQPPMVQPFAVAEFRIEQQIVAAWDAQTSPYDVIDLFAPAVRMQASLALDDLFDAADAARSAELQEPGSLPLTVALDNHSDALTALAELLRGTR